MRDIVLYGNGAHGELVYALFKEEGYNIVAFTVEEKYITVKEKFGLPIVPFENITEQYPPSDYDMFVAIGPHQLNDVREKYYYLAKEKGYHLPAFVSKKSSLCSDFKENNNVWLDHGVKAHPFVEVGENTVIIDSSIGHHTKIGKHCFIAAAILSGKVIVEDNVFIANGSVIKNGVTIGKGSIVGMGAVITKDVEPYSVYSVRGTQKREGLDARDIKLF